MPPTRGILDEFPGVRAWADDRLRALGHGQREECDAEEALRIARTSRPRPAAGGSDTGDPNGLVPGMRVHVVPDDYGFDPVEGELVASSRHEVALRREAPEVGEVVVHFPRAGFRVTEI